MKKYFTNLKNKIYIDYVKAIYQKKITTIFKIIFYPLSLLYLRIINIRKYLYKKNIFKTYRVNVPVIVVGNLTLGGTGKTPLVIHLAQELKKQRKNPGIIYRGYGVKLTTHVLTITENNYDPNILYPDEAHLTWRKTACPIAIGHNKVNALKQLLAQTNCDIIICDDGLQHSALGRDFEIVVIDGKRGFGNRHFLPFGPLREPLSRLHSVNMIIINTLDDDHFVHLKNEIDVMTDGKIPCQVMMIKPEQIINLQDQKTIVDTTYFKQKKLYALAGIGHPQRFFDTLKNLGIKNFIPVIFPDHYAYCTDDFESFIDGEIIMTEKDAVKCFNFAKNNFWYLSIKVKVDIPLLW